MSNSHKHLTPLNGVMRALLFLQCEQYSTVAQQRNPNIHVHYIAKAEIEALEKKLSDLWKEVITILGTHKYHFFMTSGESKMKVSETSTSTEYTIVKIRKSEDNQESDNNSGDEVDEHSGDEVDEHSGDEVDEHSGDEVDEHSRDEIEGETNQNSEVLQVGE